MAELILLPRWAKFIIRFKAIRDMRAPAFSIALFSIIFNVSAYADLRPVTIFAAASLTTVLSEIAEMAVEAGLPRCRCVFASSSSLARQISDGAPSDIFISANRHWVNEVVSEGVMDGETEQIIASNRLVLVRHVDRPLKLLPGRWSMLPKSLDKGWLAMADPDHVPAGIYGAAALKTLGLWDRLVTKIARAPNVRAALALVARGEAAAGIVYQSDISISDQVRHVATFPIDTHPSIEYAAVVSTESEWETIESYFAFLMSSEAQAHFALHGFSSFSGS